MKAEEFDRKFDAGEDITHALDLSKAKRHQSEQKTISVDDFRLGLTQAHDEPPAVISDEPRTPGLLNFKLGDAFFEPMSEEELREWE